MTKPKRYKRYSPKFKREAIRRAAEEGGTDKDVCDELAYRGSTFQREPTSLFIHKRSSMPWPGK